MEVRDHHHAATTISTPQPTAGRRIKKNGGLRRHNSPPMMFIELFLLPFCHRRTEIPARSVRKPLACGNQGPAEPQGKPHRRSTRIASTAARAFITPRQ